MDLYWISIMCLIWILKIINYQRVAKHSAIRLIETVHQYSVEMTLKVVWLAICKLAPKSCSRDTTIAEMHWIFLILILLSGLTRVMTMCSSLGTVFVAVVPHVKVSMQMEEGKNQSLLLKFLCWPNLLSWTSSDFSGFSAIHNVLSNISQLCRRWWL